PCLAYNRVLLSSVLAGAMPLADVELKPARWWKDRGVTLVYGRRAIAIDHMAQRVQLENGTSVPYAKLLLATGSKPIRLPVPGGDLPGVMTFRDRAGIGRLQSAAREGTRAVVIGGGLLGLEAAYGLARTGAEVAVIHLMDRLMERQLDGVAAALLKGAI